jgi:hypothetical protein
MNRNISNKTPSTFNNNKYLINEQHQQSDLADLNPDDLFIEEFSNQIMPKKENKQFSSVAAAAVAVSRRNSRRNRNKEEKIDAVLLDFDLTATRKDELMSTKFSDTFKSVLQDFTLSIKQQQQQQQETSKPKIIKHNIEIISKENIINEPEIKQQQHQQEPIIIKKTFSKPQQPINNQLWRPKTSLSFLNSSISISSKRNIKDYFSSSSSASIIKSRPMTTITTASSSKSDFNSQHVSSILFEGYEKNKDNTNNSNNSNLDDLEDMSKYISPSFRIKKYNLNDSKELELAKHDLFKRYSVFKEPLNNTRNVKSARVTRLKSSSLVV